MKKKAFAFTFLFIVHLTNQVIADELIVHHKLISANSHSGYTQLTYQIKLVNADLTDYSQLQLEPAGYDFSTSQQIQIPSLPVNGEVELIWEAESSRDRTYFLNTMPLFFNVYANADKTEISQVAYSEEY